MTQYMRDLIISTTDGIQKEQARKFLIFYAAIPEHCHGYIIGMRKGEKVLELYGSSKMTADDEKWFNEIKNPKGLYKKDTQDKTIIFCSVDIPMISLAGLFILLNEYTKEAYAPGKQTVPPVPFSFPSVNQEIVTLGDGTAFVKTKVTSAIIGNREVLNLLVMDKEQECFDAGLRKALSLYGIGKPPVHTTKHMEGDIMKEFKEFWMQRKKK